MNENETRGMTDKYIREFVAEQISAALAYKADAQEQIKLQNEVEDLKKEVERLRFLVGNASVAEQISVALIG